MYHSYIYIYGIPNIYLRSKVINELIHIYHCEYNVCVVVR